MPSFSTIKREVMFKCIFKLIFAKEIKVMKLKINKASQIIIQELIESHPSENKYIQWVAKRLGCFVSDLRLLESIHQEDEEGDNLVSFFPDKLMLQNYDWRKHLIHSDDDSNLQIEELSFSDFAIGNVYELQLFGRKMIADQNASPFVIYIRKEDVEFINDQL